MCRCTPAHNLPTFSGKKNRSTEVPVICSNCLQACGQLDWKLRQLKRINIPTFFQLLLSCTLTLYEQTFGPFETQAKHTNINTRHCECHMARVTILDTKLALLQDCKLSFPPTNYNHMLDYFHAVTHCECLQNKSCGTEVFIVK